MKRKYNRGDIVQHFKREMMTKEQLDINPTGYLYEIIGTARHTEDNAELMIYKPLYPIECTEEVDFATRSLDIFMLEVDHDKYSDIK